MKNTRSNTRLKSGETESETFQKIIEESSTTVSNTNILKMNDPEKISVKQDHTDDDLLNIELSLSEGRETPNYKKFTTMYKIILLTSYYVKWK
uniref:Uncharacterized protein n=1 Tax=Strongyloides venezuelensis TaxID=75913 RepID=A0A0K0FFI8_STRVS